MMLRTERSYAACTILGGALAPLRSASGVIAAVAPVSGETRLLSFVSLTIRIAPPPGELGLKSTPNAVPSSVVANGGVAGPATPIATPVRGLMR